MKKIFLVIALALLFILPIISATTIQVDKVIPSVTQGTCANLYETCSNCSYVNITSILIQGQVTPIASNLAMEKTGTYFNYTFCNTDTIGVYTYLVEGDLNGDIVTEGISFEVTKTGIQLSDAETNISTSSIYFILAMGIIFIVVGLMIMRKGFWAVWIGLFCIAVGFIFLYYDLSMVNLYMNTINVSSSAPSGIFLLFARFIKVFPYVVALIVGFAIVKLLKESIKLKNSKDGWDSNNY